MRFWDASAVVPLIVDQAATASIRAAAATDPAAIVWWGTRVECLSALARLEREERIDAAGMAASVGRLAEASDSWHEVQPGARLRQVAERLIRVHPLRAADALQLAAAVMAAADDPGSLPIVTLDERLAEAARREGFPVVTAG
jgi:predicted nucleic acid-binding protein